MKFLAYPSLRRVRWLYVMAPLGDPAATTASGGPAPPAVTREPGPTSKPDRAEPGDALRGDRR